MKTIYLSLTLFAVALGVYLLLDSARISFGNIFACFVFLAVAVLWAAEGLNLKFHRSRKHSHWDGTHVL